MISITVNGETINVEQNTEFLEDATEEFDVGSAVIINSESKTPYADFSDIVITMGSYEIKTILQKDLVTRTSNGRYQHQLVFTEYAIKLAMYQHPDRKFDTVDGEKTTYKYHLETLLETIVSYLGITTEITVDSDTLTLLNVLADEKEYTSGNLLLTLVDMFRYVGAIPTFNENNVIGHKLLADIGDEISFTRVDGEVIESDIGDYGYRVYSKVKNATYEADLITGGTYYPSKTGSVSVRSLDNKYIDTQAVYIVDSNIRRMIQGLTSSYSTYTNLVINIVSKDEWEELETCRVLNSGSNDGTNTYEDDYKNNTPYYDGNVIYNVGTEYSYSGAVPDQNVISQAIRRAIYKLNTVVVPPSVSVSPRDIDMNFFYQPIRNMDVSQIRYDYNRVLKNATVLNTQKDSTLELARYGTACKQYINRIGNDKYSVTVRYFDGDTPFEVFDYTSDGYKIVKRQFIWRGSSFDVKYELTKNQSILNPITGVKYESVSPFTITKKQILTNYLREEYYEFSRINKSNTGTDISTIGSILLNAFNYSSTYDTPIWNATYRRDASDYIAMPCTPFPMGNSFQFNVQFNHPKFAGYQYVADTIGNRIEPLVYTDEYGQAETVQLSFTTEPTSVSADTYPLSTGFGTPILSTPSFFAKLQPNENFGATETRHCITDIEGFIIGDYFLQNNSLVKTLSGAQTLTLGVYDTNQKYTIYDKKRKTSPDSTGTISYTPGNDYITLTGVTGKSWVIYNSNVLSDDYLKIYFAYNYTGTSLIRIYLNQLKFDPNIGIL